MTEKKQVLIVDDAQFTRTMLRKIIQQLDYVEICGEAKNGNEALTQYKKLKPDLVTMDLVMPEKGGIEAIEAIKKTDSMATIVVVSALGQEALVMEAAQKGAKDFITKPFKKEQIFDVMNRIFNQKANA